VINKRVQNELGEEVFSQALDIFMKNAKKDFMLLNLYTESKDYTNAKATSHKLIGSCLAIGIKKIPTLLRKLDEDLKKRYYNSNDLLEINTMYEELKSYVQQEYNLEIEA
jgi:HPt (histidine-containing phosphotransfer) domain-containing protein